MSTSKEFLTRLRAGNASFYLADFHVHSPASDDFRGEHKVDPQSEDVKQSLADDATGSDSNQKTRHESAVIETQPVSIFYNALVQQRDAIVEREGIRSGENWAFVAITDHDVCRNAVRLAKYAWDSARLKKNRLIILPGIELSVDFPVPDTDSIASCHLLLVFPAKTEVEHIYAVIREASGKPWEFGETLSIPDLPKFVNAIRHHSSHSAICIAAHIGSSKGVREEAKNCILSYLEAEISRAEGELEDPDLQGRSALEHRLDSFKEKHSDSDAVSIDVLRLIGKCGFDAIQTRGRKDEAYYRRLHRYRDEFGRSVSVVCSDAHDVNLVFEHRDSPESEAVIPYVKLSSSPNTADPMKVFLDIRDKALKFGETRTTHRAPVHITSWIEGIEIIPDSENAARFWPFTRDSDGIPERFTVPLSQNLNCIIGGRGSGKSALIETLAFLSKPDDFDGQTIRNSEDWYKRATATLGGCRVRLCWRLMGSDGAELPKKALFVERYFDSGNQHPPVTLANFADKEVLAGTISPPSVHVFRIHDIEETAKPERLRILFDTICGSEMSKLSEDIGDAVAALAEQRERLVATANKIAKVAKENTPLRQYGRRKKSFDEVNRQEIQEQYERIDEASAAAEIVDGVEEDWTKIGDGFDIAEQKSQIAEFFHDAHQKLIVVTDSEDDDSRADPSSSTTNFRPHCKQVEDALKGVEAKDGVETAAEQRINIALDSVASEYAKVTEGLSSAKDAIEVANQSAREVLLGKGIPTGSAERQTKKIAFDESERELGTYRELWEEWAELVESRQGLYDNLRSLCKQRTEIRRATAGQITSSLAADLDPSVLKIEADAQPVADVEHFLDWLSSRANWRVQQKDKRYAEMVTQIAPESLRSLLLTKENPDVSQLVNDKASAAEGRITEDDAIKFISGNAGLQQLDVEIAADEDSVFFESLPVEIQEGLWTFPTFPDGKELLLNAVLELDEVVLDDLPEIRLNDRPWETETMRPLGKLSPGQRCSAILPILLLNGTSPLVIDQPEDNLDTRLIRQVIVNVLSSIKLKRQVIVATHNPNLPVLGDAEQVIVLRAVADEQSQLEASGDLDNQRVVSSITNIMEGGREAFQYRHSIYQKHWTEGAEADAV